MEIRAQTGQIEEIPAEAVVLAIFEDKTAPAESAAGLSRLNEALGGAIQSLLDSEEIKGKAHETTLIHTLGRAAPARVLLVGLGKKETLSLRTVRQAAGVAARFLRKKGCRRIAMPLIGSASFGSAQDKSLTTGGTGQDISAADSARAIVEGALTALYSPDLHKTGEREPHDLEELLLIHAEAAALEPAINAGRITAEALSIARDLGNEPANILNPTTFAQRAQQLAEEVGLEMHVLEEEDMRRLGMGALLAVSAGSEQPAKLVVLRHKCAGGASGRPIENATLLTLVGKGITFDSGGIDLKPREGMEKMKNDMAGAAAVLGAMWAISRLGIKVNVLGLLPLTENLPGGRAYRPGDVLRTMAGKTVEVLSTDAEGRLILADALAYAVQQGATHILDIATLTGSCAVALGGQASGLFSPDDDLADVLVEIGEQSGERLWRLPLYPEYKEELDSKLADMKNIGSRYGDACNAATFLRQFTADKPWAHLDIAATDWNEKGRPYLAEGPTGVGVGLMVRLAERMAQGEGA